MTQVEASEFCGVEDEGCLTCGDVAVALTIVSRTDDGDALCTDEHGRTEIVATTLVGEVDVGARLLVHARVAIALLEDGGITT